MIETNYKHVGKKATFSHLPNEYPELSVYCLEQL